MDIERWQEIKSKHHNFWLSPENNSTAIVGRKRLNAFTLAGMGNSLNRIKDRAIEIDDINTEEVCSAVEKEFSSKSGFLDDELVWGASPLPGIPWMETILGSSIHFSEGSGSIWPKPFLHKWDDLYCIKPLEDDLWFKKLIEISASLARHAYRRYPMSTTNLSGISDILAAIRGYDRFCVDFYENPEHVRRAIEYCTQLWVEVAKTMLDIIPPYDEGYTPSRLELWAPGKIIRLQEDASILLSPAMFEAFFKDSIEYIVSNFKYSIIHTHSEDYRIVDILLTIDQLDCIQILIDEKGPDLDELLPVFRKVLESKKLLITHEKGREFTNKLLFLLPPKGLAIEEMMSV